MDEQFPCLPERDLRMNRYPRVRIKQVRFLETLGTVRTYQADSTGVTTEVNLLHWGYVLAP